MVNRDLLQLDPWQLSVMRIFYPQMLKRVDELPEGSRFVHYTTAETARKILTNNQVWMRKSTVMNDFREIQHGRECLEHALQNHKRRFEEVLEGLFPGICEEVLTFFNSWYPYLRDQSFIACVSEHDETEDTFGRLSMWRAYGGATGVALVLKAEPFLAPSDALKAYTSPVAYLDAEGLAQEFLEFLDGIEAEAEFVRNMPRPMVKENLFQVFRYAVLCTKHRGFREEREWRIMYTPRLLRSERIKVEIESVGGTPQLVAKIPLQDVPDENLMGIEVPELIDRIIIGPTQFPFEIKEAFVELLAARRAPELASKVIVSDIPLRT